MDTPKPVTRVALLEDAPGVAAAYAAVLNQAGDFNCTAIYATAAAARAGVPAASPDLLLVDLQLPDQSGAACLAVLKAQLPDLCCVVLTQFEDDDLIFAALQAGADGYLLKRQTHSAFLSALRAVRDGTAGYAPSIHRRIREHLERLAPVLPIAGRLTPREQELLRLAERGHDNKAIAKDCDISYETVRTHWRNIHKKLQAVSRTDALNKWRQSGLE